MPTSKRSTVSPRNTSKKSALNHPAYRTKDMAGAIKDISKAYKHADESARYFEGMIGGLSHSLQEYKQKAWWKSPHHDPDKILGMIRSNAGSVIDALLVLSMEIWEAKEIEKETRGKRSARRS